jgi:predicted lipoprotein with Yx(FWY)xxD motif
MPRPLKPATARRRSRSFTLALAIAGFVVAALAGVALAKSFTLTIAKNEKVSNITKATAPTKTESIVANSKGGALYTLSGDSKSNPKCTDATCRKNWPPLTVASAKSKPTAAPGIKGKLGVVHRGKIFQVTWNGHPLYTFAFDKGKGKAMGDGVVAFGGTWHVIATSSSKATNNPPPPMNPLPPGY